MLVLLPEQMMAKIRDVTQMDLKLYEAALRLYNEVGGATYDNYTQDRISQKDGAAGVSR